MPALWLGALAALTSALWSWLAESPVIAASLTGLVVFAGTALAGWLRRPSDSERIDDLADALSALDPEPTGSPAADSPVDGLSRLARTIETLRARLAAREATHDLTVSALREQERVLTTLMANLPGMVYRCRNDEAWTMELVSEGSRELTGHAPDDLIGNRVVSYGDLIHADDRQAVWEGVQNALRSRLPFRLTYRIHASDGAERHVWEQGRGIFDGHGTLLWLEGFITDVTHRWRAEEALRASEEQLLQVQKMEAIGRLAGGIAHDFNNLLTAILGYSDMLAARLPATEPARGQVEEIRRAGERAAGLVRQLLAFSRKQVLSPRVIRLGAVVLAMEPMLARLIGEDIALSHHASDTRAVRADPVQLEQIIINLVVNARDAMPGGGRLNITTGDVDLDSDGPLAGTGLSPGPFVRLSIEDSGEGMDPETMAHLFEPFFTTKAIGRGTGLGLSTVYGIVKQGGGHVSARSAPGLGTVFEVVLPAVADQSVDGSDRGAVLESSIGVETVLVAEDEIGVRRLVIAALERQGYTVIEAANGLDALAAVEERAGPIDLLLTDVVMPEMGGVALAQRILERRPGIKVLLVSGYSDDLIDHDAVIHGERLPFLQKPFSVSALLERVRDVLDGRSA